MMLFIIIFLDGLNADSIKQSSQHLNSRWTDFCQLLSERLSWLEYQNSIIAFYSQLQQLEQTAITAENWLKAQSTTASEAEIVKTQLQKCKVRDIMCKHLLSLSHILHKYCKVYIKVLLKTLCMGSEHQTLS